MKQRNRFLIFLFALLLALPLMLTLILPDRDFSEWENRALAKKPAVTAEKVLSGQFGREAETYLTDQFCFRDTFMKLNRLKNSFLCITEENGVLITRERLFDIPDAPDQAVLEKNISAIGRFRDKYSLPTTCILIPSALTVTPDALPSFAPAGEEENLIGEIYASFAGIETVDVLSPMRKAADYLYYRTDHHFTAEGAKTVYEAWKKHPADAALVAVSDDFEGTLLSRSGALGIPADTLYRIDGTPITSCTVFDGREETDFDGYYFDEYLKKKDKYAYYGGQNNPMVTLTTASETGKRLLVFRDSFASSLAPFFAQDYSEIVMIDCRYLNAPLSTLVDVTDFDEALFCYSCETFFTEWNMVWIDK